MVTAMPGEGARRRLAATRFADLRWHAELDSTNRVLLDLARDGAPEGVVVVADHQTAGRGRLGRTWLAPPGSSLLVSMLLRPRDLPTTRLHLVSSAAALAAADACADVADVRAELKWPNDLLGGDRKLAGLLAEAMPGAVVVGLGVNVNWPVELPPELRGTAVALNHLAGRDIDREELLIRLLELLDRRLDEGWDAVARDYRARCATVGRRVRVELAVGDVLTGTAVGTTDAGHLVVDAEDGARRVIAVGDVAHLRPAV